MKPFSKYCLPFLLTVCMSLQLFAIGSFLTASAADSADYPAQLAEIATQSGSAVLTGTGTKNQSPVTAIASDGARSQQWRFDYVTTGVFRIVNQNSGMVLTENGSSVFLKGNTNTYDQYWHIAAVSQDARGNDLYYTLSPYRDSSLALTNSGGNLSLTAKSGNPAQQFLLSSVGLEGFAGYAQDMEGNVKASAIGGLLGKTVYVDTWNDLVAACTSDDPMTIVITKNISCPASYKKDSNGRYVLTSSDRIYMHPNKTVIGSYNANTLYNVYLHTYDHPNYGQGSNLIFRNLTVTHDKELNNDNIFDFAYGENIWVDHCSFVGHDAVNTASTGQDDWDKFLTFKGPTNYCTVTGCSFGLHEYGVLIGHPEDTDATMAQYNGSPSVTLMNNYYHNCLTRAPGLLRYGYFHSLNNVVENFNLGYTIHTCAKLYAENCYYDGGTGKGSVVNDNISNITNLSGSALAQAGPWYIDSGSTAVNCYNNNNLKNIYSKPLDWRPSSNYSYTVLSAEDARIFAKANAGAQSTKGAYSYAGLTESGTPSAFYLTMYEEDKPREGAVMDETVLYQFQNVQSGQYLEVADGTAANAANVQQWGSHAPAAHNTWKLVSASDGYYYLYSMLADGSAFLLDLDMGNPASGANIQIYQNTNSTAQQFKFVKNEDGSYTIRTRVTQDQSCVEVANGSTASGANVQQWEENGAACQNWIAVPVNPQLFTTTTAATTTTAPATTTTVTTTTAPPIPDFTPGDVNNDGRINGFDLAIMKRKLLVSAPTTYAGTAYDVNNDGDFTLLDLIRVQKFLLGETVSLEKSTIF